VLVTGATGLVGRQLLWSLCRRDVPVVAALRGAGEWYPEGRPVSVRRIADIGPDTDWQAALRGVDRVVHLAAHVHVMRGDSAADYWRVNAEGTRRLARQAAASGVRCFVFMSSIKVNGECTADRPFRAEDVLQPMDDYAISKLAAERAMWTACIDTGM
jgi:UDP-glucose 4-epimerase